LTVIIPIPAGIPVFAIDSHQNVRVEPPACRQKATMIGKKQNAFLFAHQANIDRYQRILQTQLTAEERRFVETFLDEQQAALKQREFFIECLWSSLPPAA
jgi:hypothetical protein